MEILQRITNTLNKENDCPASIDKCELLYDTDNVRVLLMLRLNGLKTDAECVFDVCCYGNDGIRLSALENITYENGGILVTLPSLMTVNAEIIIRSVSQDGTEWKSNESFSSAAVSDDTMNFDSASITEAIEEKENRPCLTRAEKKAVRKQRAAEEEEIRQFIKNDPHEKRKRIMVRILTLLIIAVLCYGCYYVYNYKTNADTSYKRAMNLYNSGKFEEALAEFRIADEYILTGDKQQELDWCMAMSYSRQREFFPAAVYYKRADGYKESHANYRSIIQAYSSIVAAGSNHTVMLKSDGSVTSVGDNGKEQCAVDSWSDIIRIAAGGNHTLGIKSDNTVVSCGDNSKKQCNTNKWKNIIAIACGANHSVGVEKTGRVVAVGDNTFGQCEIDDWSGVIYASAGNEHTVGLKIDGSVIACGNNSSGACNVSDWSDIALVTAGNGFTVGLKYDGTIVYTGSVPDEFNALKKLKNVLSVASGGSHVLVLHDNGTVSAFGSNNSNQTVTSLWKNIVAISGGDSHSVGICADGTVHAAGNNSDGQLDISSINNIGIPKSTVTIRKGEEQ